MKILLVSHGSIAQGFVDTLKTFFGVEGLYCANVDIELGVKKLKEDIAEYLSQWRDEQVVICTDIKGGSSTQTVIPFLENENVTVISGMNMALIMQLAMMQYATKANILEAIELAKNDLNIVNLNEINMDEEDE